MASAQKMGGIAGFNDHERSYSLALAPRLELDLAPSKFVYKKPRTFEESLGLCVRVAEHVRKKQLIPDDAPIAWVFDSLASMVPESVLLDMKTKKDRDLADGRNMNDTSALARATSAHFPAFAQYLEELGVCGIFLNQIRMKVGVVYGDARKTPGGEAPYFYDSQKIMLSNPKKITKGTGEEAEVLGMEITALVAKNKITRPFRKATWRFMFQPDGYGRFDVERSTIDFLLKQKMIEAGRAGYAIWDGKQVHVEALARQIEKEGRMAELLALLPKEYEPEVGKPEDVYEDE